MDRHRLTSSFSSRRVSKAKKILLPAGKFCALVICSALLSFWMQQQWTVGDARTKNATLKRYSRKNAATAESTDGATSETPDPAISSVGKMEDLYRKHLEEILHTLRANPSIRMVKLMLPNLILNYQRNLASLEDGSTLRLQARTTEIPVLAISVGSRRLLEQMLITYIDPRTIPPRVIDGSNLPFNPKMLPQFLLVPDLSSTNAAMYTFEKR